MTTLNDVCENALLNLEGYGLIQPRACWLTQDILATDLAFTVSSVDNVSEGMAELGGTELVYIGARDPSSATVTIAPDGRGYRGTTAADFLTGTRLVINPTFPKQTVFNSVNDTIRGLYPLIWGTGSTEFTQAAARTTYEVPAEVMEIAAVTWETIGPSKEWAEITNYSLDTDANTTAFMTGKSITIGTGVVPGQKVRVTYKKAPTPGTLTSTLADCGLQESAGRLLMLGAAADMVSFMDPARLAVGSAEMDAIDQTVQAGMAVQVASLLTKRYQEELVEERRRLLKQTPPRIKQIRR